MRERVGLTYMPKMVFIATLAVLGAVNFFVPTTSIPSGYTYFVFVGGVLPIFFLGSVVTPTMRVVPYAVVMMYLFGLFSIGAAGLRGDFSTVTNLALMIGTLLAIILLKIRVSIQFINWLFIASIFAGIFSSAAGISIYSQLPFLGGDENLPWRVSIFPKAPETAFLCSTVLIANIVSDQGNKYVKWIAAYFLMFSGIRSVIIFVSLAVLLILLQRRNLLHRRTSIAIFVVCSVGFVLAFLAYGQVLAFILSRHLPSFLQEFAFRTDGSFGSIEEVQQSVYRVWLWKEHFNIVGSAWPIGIGTFDFNKVAYFPDGIGAGDGSESYWTGLFARIGVPSVIFLSSLVVLATQRRQPNIAAPVALVLIGLGFTYGTFFVPYSMNFLLMISLIANGLEPSRKSIKLKGT